MTANEDAIDLDAIEDRWLRSCPSCDAGMSMTCQCPTGDPRNVISSLVDEIRRLRTSIGPDSERIRELEAEVEKYKSALDEIDRTNPDDFRTGQGHLSPAFREVNFRAAFAHVCRIVNRTLHGIDGTEGPSR